MRGPQLAAPGTCPTSPALPCLRRGARGPPRPDVLQRGAARPPRLGGRARRAPGAPSSPVTTPLWDSTALHMNVFTSLGSRCLPVAKL